MNKGFLFWLMFADEEGGTGSDPGTPADSGSAQEPSGDSFHHMETSNTTETSQPTETQQEQAPSHNPNWNGLLEALPDEYIRGKALPFLEEFDRNNNKRFEKVQQQFSPYQPLVDNNIPFEDIELAFRLRNEISNNPQFIFEKLAERLGHDISKLSAPNAPQNSQGLPNDPEDSDLEDLDPRIKQYIENQKQVVATQNAMLQQMMMNQQSEIAENQQKQERQWYNDTVQTLDKLKVPAENNERNRFVQFALMEQQMSGARTIDWNSSWNKYLEWRGPQANLTAPDVTPGNGNLQTEAFDFKKSSDDDVNDLAIRMLKQRNSR